MIDDDGDDDEGAKLEDDDEGERRIVEVGIITGWLFAELSGDISIFEPFLPRIQIYDQFTSHTLHHRDRHIKNTQLIDFFVVKIRSIQFTNTTARRRIQ